MWEWLQMSWGHLKSLGDTIVAYWGGMARVRTRVVIGSIIGLFFVKGAWLTLKRRGLPNGAWPTQMGRGRPKRRVAG
jgi:hypothetical protein